ncbi:MAG: MPT63 family protein [Mycobacterium sp.]
MKKTTVTTVFATTVVGMAPMVIGQPIAAADSGLPERHFGDRIDLVDGPTVQTWTVSSLKRSADSIPYPVRGTLWEATATGTATRGDFLPIIPNFRSQARDGAAYGVLFQVPTTKGVNPSSLREGQSTTGKIYFDVTGESPDSVVYNTGGGDPLLWVQPPTGDTGSASVAIEGAPAERGATPRATRDQALPAPTAAPAPNAAPAPPVAPASTPVAPNVPTPPTAAGWQGTPLPPEAPVPGTETDSGTGPLGTGPLGVQQGTPLPPATPPPAGRMQGTPLPPPPLVAQQGTPLPPGAPVPDSEDETTSTTTPPGVWVGTPIVLGPPTPAAAPPPGTVP